MINTHTIFATWFGAGFIRPASGTWGTVASLPLVLFTVMYAGHFGIIIGSMILFCVGLWAADAYEKETGEHDSSRIVIDEACGMMIAAIPLLYDFTVIMILFCFALFRFFDAWKAGIVGWLDKNVSGAFGVMIDDVAAGFLTAIVMAVYLLCI